MVAARPGEGTQQDRTSGHSRAGALAANLPRLMLLLLPRQMLLNCKQMLRIFSPASRPHQGSRRALNNPANVELHDPPPPILLPEFTRISIMVSMSVLFARMKFREIQRVGRAGRAGLSSILVVSRSGPQMKVRQPLSSKRKVAISRLHANGGAQVATYHRTSSRSHLPVGARRRSIPGHSRDYHPSLAEILARETV